MGFIAATAPDPLTYAPANTVVPVPAGTLDGDTMVTILSTAQAGAQAIPAGWTFGAQIIAFAADQAWHLYYRIASSEPASYTWVNNLVSGFFHAVCLTYRGTTIAGAPVGGQSAQLAVDNVANSPRVFAVGAGATPVVDTTILYVNMAKDGFAMTPSTWTDEPSSTRRIVGQHTDPINFPGAILSQTVVGDAYEASAPGQPAFTATHTWGAASSSHGIAQLFFVLGGAPVTAVPGFGFGEHPFGP